MTGPLPSLRTLAARAARHPLAPPTWPGTVDRPPPERHTGLAYDPAWSRTYPVRLARAVLLDDVARPLARLVAPTTVRGGEYLATLDGPVIFAADHASHLDTPLLLTALPVRFRHRCVVAAAADYFFDTTWKATLWSFMLAAIPIDRTRVNRRSADEAARLLDEGWNLVIFPEGGRSPDGWAREFRGGAAYLARRTGRPIVPVHLRATSQVLGKAPDPPPGPHPPGGSGTESTRAGRIRRAPVTVTFGLPLWPGPREDARRLGTRVEQAVALLAAESSTDFWRARRLPPEDLVPAARGPAASSWRRSWALGPPGTGGSARTARTAQGATSRRWPRSGLPVQLP